MSSTNPLNNNDLLVYHVADRLQQNTPDSAVIQEIQKRGASEKEATSIFSDGVKYALQKSKTEAISNLIWGITTVLIGAVALYVLIWAIAWLRFPDHATFGPPGRSPGGPGGPTLIMGIPQPLFIMTLLVGIQCLAVIIYGLSRLLKSWLNFRWLRLRANMTQFELE
jgi:hypothetical protein